MTTSGSDHTYRTIPDPPSAVPAATAVGRQDILGDRAGRTLYEQRSALLSGLGQPAAPAWQDLDEGVRRRWCGHAAREFLAGAGR